jgi:uncharacterized protein YifE (UPF0438 family)
MEIMIKFSCGHDEKAYPKNVEERRLLRTIAETHVCTVCIAKRIKDEKEDKFWRKNRRRRKRKKHE